MTTTTHTAKAISSGSSAKGEQQGLTRKAGMKKEALYVISYYMAMAMWACGILCLWLCGCSEAATRGGYSASKMICIVISTKYSVLTCLLGSTSLLAQEHLESARQLHIWGSGNYMVCQLDGIRWKCQAKVTWQQGSVKTWEQRDRKRESYAHEW